MTLVLVISLALGVQLTGQSDPQPLRSELFKELKCPKEPVPVFEGRVNYLWVNNIKTTKHIMKFATIFLR